MNNMLAALHQLAASTCFAAIMLSTDDYLHDLACGSAGMFGGAITQLLTLDERNPTRKVIIGEILCGLVGGWGTYVLSSSGLDIRQAVLAAILAGAMGSALFKAAVKRMKPAWLDAGGDKP
jgi:4-amino-4-deoxy-L-arabinose transferase-like glycosyltransferase